MLQDISGCFTGTSNVLQNKVVHFKREQKGKRAIYCEKMNFHALDVKVVKLENAVVKMLIMCCLKFYCLQSFSFFDHTAFSPRHCEGISINGINAKCSFIVKIFTIISHHEKERDFTLENDAGVYCAAIIISLWQIKQRL